MGARGNDALLECRVAIRSTPDNIDTSTLQGRMLLGPMVTFAEYERTLLQERVHVGVDAARARGVKFGRPPADPIVVGCKLRIIDQLIIDEGISVAEAAKRRGGAGRRNTGIAPAGCIPEEFELSLDPPTGFRVRSVFLKW